MRAISIKKANKKAEFKITDRSKNQIISVDLESASHYSVNAVVVVKTATGAKTLNGRLFGYDKCIVK